jgi:Mn2+/Fe2+ NRAMP family transporter
MRWSYLARFLSSILPGLFMVGYVIGTGSVTTMAKAGSDYGMSLVWTLVLASLFTHIMFSAISKTTIVGGQTMLWGFRRNFGHIGFPVALAVTLAMVVTQVASIIGVMGIVTDVVREWSRPLTASGEGISRVWSGAIFTLLLLWLFWNGRHQLFLKVLSLLVALMGVCFLLTAAVVPPDPAAVLRGFIPSVPATGNPQLLIAGMVGTTLASVCLFSRSIVIQEKGWKVADLRIAYRDSLISAVMLLVINAAIMACAAGTLFVEGLRVEQAIDMVRTLEPVAGRFAVTAFVVGIVAAGLSSLFPSFILGPWMISDLMGKPREMHRWGYRIMVLATSSFAMVVPVFGGSPVHIMITSQAVSPLIMPVITLFTWLLLLKPASAGKSPNTPWMNLGLAVTLLFTLYMMYTAIRGFLASGIGG